MSQFEAGVQRVKLTPFANPPLFLKVKRSWDTFMYILPQGPVLELHGVAEKDGGEHQRSGRLFRGPRGDGVVDVPTNPVRRLVRRHPHTHHHADPREHSTNGERGLSNGCHYIEQYTYGQEYINNIYVLLFFMGLCVYVFMFFCFYVLLFLKKIYVLLVWCISGMLP